MALKLSMQAEAEPSSEDKTAPPPTQKKRKELEHSSGGDASGGGKEGGELKKSRSGSVSSVAESQSGGNSRRKSATPAASSSSSSSSSSSAKDKDKDDKDKDPPSSTQSRSKADNSKDGAPVKKTGGHNQWTKKRELEAAAAARERERLEENAEQSDASKQSRVSDAGAANKPPRSHKKKDGRGEGGGGGLGDTDSTTTSTTTAAAAAAAAAAKKNRDRKRPRASSTASASSTRHDQDSADSAVSAAEPSSTSGSAVASASAGEEETGDNAEGMLSPSSDRGRSRTMSSMGDNDMDDNGDGEAYTPRYRSSRAAAEVAKSKISNKGNPKYGVIEEPMNESEFSVYRTQSRSTPRDRDSNSNSARKQEKENNKERERAQPKLEVGWVQCDKCDKWRTVPGEIDADSLPDSWFCEMDTWSKGGGSCDIPESTDLDPDTDLYADDDALVGGDMSAAASELAPRSKSKSRSRSRNSAGVGGTGTGTGRDSLGGHGPEADAPYGYSADGKHLAMPPLPIVTIEWIACSKCDKWRTYPSGVIDIDPENDDFTCQDNTWAPQFADCSVPEEEESTVVKLAEQYALQEQQRQIAAIARSQAMQERSHLGQSRSGRRGGGGSAHGAGGGDDAAAAAAAAAVAASGMQWVQCERKSCNKWRKVPKHIDMAVFPPKWFCELNTWDPDRASCDIPESEDEGGEVTQTNVRTSLIATNSKGPGTLSYRRIIFGTDGKVRPAYSESGTRGYGIFSHVEPSPVGEDEKVEPLRTMSYWWSEQLVDHNGPCTRPRNKNLVKQVAAAAGADADATATEGGCGSSESTANTAPASPVPTRSMDTGSSVSSPPATGTTSGVDMAAVNLPMSRKLAPTDKANPAASTMPARAGICGYDPEDAVDSLGVRVLLDKNNNNGYTNHINYATKRSSQLLSAARKLAGFPDANPTLFSGSGSGKFSKNQAMNRRITMMERVLYEDTIIRSLLQGSGSTVGKVPVSSILDTAERHQHMLEGADNDGEPNRRRGRGRMSNKDKDKERARERGGSRSGEEKTASDKPDAKDRDGGGEGSGGKGKTSTSSRDRDRDRNRHGKDKSPVETDDSDSESDESSDDEPEPLVSTDYYGRGAAAGSVSLHQLLHMLRHSYFHSPGEELIRATFDMDKLRTVVRRLEQQGECFVSISTIGEPCVQALPIHGGCGAGSSADADTTQLHAPELSQAHGFPLRMRKILLRRRDEKVEKEAAAAAATATAMEVA